MSRSMGQSWPSSVIRKLHIYKGGVRGHTVLSRSVGQSWSSSVIYKLQIYKSGVRGHTHVKICGSVFF